MLRRDGGGGSGAFRAGSCRVGANDLGAASFATFLCCSAVQCDKHLIWRPLARYSSSTRPCNQGMSFPRFARLHFLTMRPLKLPCLPGAACYQLTLGGKWCGFLPSQSSHHRNCCLGFAREPLEPLAPRDAHTRIHRATSCLLDARQSPARRVAADAEHADEAFGEC